MALPTQDLVRPLKNNQVTISQILYIIDTCYSQSGAGDIIKFLSNAIKQYEAVRGANIAIHVMAACRAKDTAIEGVLSRSLQQALDDIKAIDFYSHRGYVDLGWLVDKMNQNVDSNQRVNYSALGIETYARFFPTYPKADQKWENQRFNLIEKLFNTLNINSDNSLFLINSFLLVYEDPKSSSISNIQELRGNLKDLSSKPVNKEICPLILFSEWCRLKLFKDETLDIAEDIDTWKGEAVRYRDGVQLDTIKKYARELWDKFNKIIELEGRIQIVISPAIDKHNNTGLQTEYFHVNTMFFVGINNKTKLWNIYKKEESFIIEEMQDSFYQVIPEMFYYLPDRVRLELEFFLPFALLKHSLEDIKFRCGDGPSIGYEYPVFINSFDRYFDEDFREIRDKIEDIKRALWENNSDLDQKHYYIGTEPSIADLEEIVESRPIAVWSRNAGEPMTDKELKPSEWRNWPDNIKELRRNKRKIALFWDDLYPKPSPRPRPLNTKVLEGAILRPLIAPGPASANAILQVGEKLRTKQILYRFPIFNLSPAHFATWAKFIPGSGGNSIQGVLMGATTAGVNMGETGEEEAAAPEAEPPEELLRGFLIDASPLARELAKVLAAVPLIPPVMRLAQRRFLPDSKHWHLAEVFFSGLVEKSTFSPEGATVPDAWYDFHPGIRQLLLADSANRRTIDIWRGIGDYIRDHYGEFRDFSALIPNPQGSLADAVSDRSLYFAEVDAAVLRTWGGEYADIAQNIEERVRQRKQEILTPEKLLKFPFETLYVDKRGEITKREFLEAYYYQEPLGEGIEPLTMVAIPGGEFLMGSPGEKDDDKSEKPQHPVSVSAFYLSQTLITRAQWRFVAHLPREGKDLDPDPAEFKESDNNPVESVSWYDAIEFCARLSRHTGKNYRLPSEAEWEYACRAGTTTPFHFGETITGELANYDSSTVYQQEKAKESPKKTTPVRSYPPNAFGLYDMHGNVWEWCLDPWHSDYQGAPPTDGSVWDETNNDNRYENLLNSINKLLTDDRDCVLRGGSWFGLPNLCRSAFRYSYARRGDYYIDGFRVVCGAGRTL